MKCPKCDFLISETAQRCSRCGTVLKAVGPSTHAPISPTPRVPQSEQPSQDEPSSESIPQWRKEVSRKVKAFEEKKKYLTTPPGPFKESEARDPTPQPSAPAAVEPEKGAAFKPPPQRLPARERKETADPPHRAVPHAATTVDPPVDIRADDVRILDFLEVEEDEEDHVKALAAPLYMARRLGAFIADNTILVVLHWVLLYFCGQIIGYDLGVLLRSAWLPLAGVFLLFHCVYYVYFYKTSRQTPGQVFFGIELRDPYSGTISLGKILIRWAAMVFLNVLNLLPFVSGRRELLLDQLSRTEIRRMN